MSPWTKRLQRSTRRVAPFSGLSASVCARARGANTAAPVPTPATAAALAEPSRNLRRFKGVSFISGVSCRSRVVIWRGARRRRAALGRETRAAAGVEQMRTRELGHEVDRAAGREVVTLAKDRGHLGAAVAAGDQRVGARGLEDDDLRGDA